MALLLLTFLAFLLRVQHLAFESFDLDETDAVYQASQGWGTLLGRFFQPGENGPLFFLLLRSWMELAGKSEFALRFFSLVFGVLLVPLLYLLGRRLIGAQGALIAAFLAAFSSYLLYYAQMNKMYALLVALTVLSSYLLLRALEERSKALWAAYLGTTAAILYVHIFGAMVVAFHLLFLIMGGKRYGRVRRWGLVAEAFLLLPYLPLGLWHVNTALRPETLQRQYGGPTHLPGMMEVLVREYGARSTLWPDLVSSLLFGGLTILGLTAMVLAVRRDSHAVGPVFLTINLAFPLVLTYGLLLVDLPLFSSRYLILTLPAFFLLWASGIGVLRQGHRSWAVAALAAVALLNWTYLTRGSWEGVHFREDWRSAVRYLEQRYLDGDALLLVHPDILRPVGYYGRQDIVTLKPEDLPSGTGAATVSGDAARVWGSYRRLWTVLAYYELPDMARISGWLEQHAQITQEQWFHGVLVRQYLPKSLAAAVPEGPQRRVGANFGNKLLLLGYDLGPAPMAPGQPWQLRLYWQAREPMDADYRISLRLMDSSGHLWGRSEGPLGSGFSPTSRWPVGQTVGEERELGLLPGTPPDTYRLALRVYNPETRQDLTLIPLEPAAPQEKFLGTLHLSRPVPGNEATLPGKRLDIDFAGGLRLLAGEAAPDVVKPGHEIHLTLSWKTERTLQDHANLQFWLTDSQGQTMANWRAVLGPEVYPPPQWRARETVTQKSDLVLPERLRNGTYHLWLGLEEADGRDRASQRGWLPWGRGDPILATIQVLGRERSFKVPPLPRPMVVQLGEVVRFLGFDPQGLAAKVGGQDKRLRLRPGEEAQFTLYWQAMKEIDQSFTVFTHLADSQGRIWGQHDGLPGDGTAPTSGWLLGEVVADPHRFTVVRDAPPGEYRLEVGLYDLATGQRLATKEGQDRIVLALVTIGQEGE